MLCYVHTPCSQSTRSVCRTRHFNRSHIVRCPPKLRVQAKEQDGVRRVAQARCMTRDYGIRCGVVVIRRAHVLVGCYETKLCSSPFTRKLPTIVDMSSIFHERDSIQSDEELPVVAREVVATADDSASLAPRARSKQRVGPCASSIAVHVPSEGLFSRVFSLTHVSAHLLTY